jgi:hypothetical protein
MAHYASLRHFLASRRVNPAGLIVVQLAHCCSQKSIKGMNRRLQGLLAKYFKMDSQGLQAEKGKVA